MSTSLLPFFLLVLALSIPFWVAGAVAPRQLLPGLPVSALMSFCPLIAASILVYRDGGAAGVTALLKRALDYGRSRPKAWYLIAVLLMPCLVVASYWLMRAAGSPLPDPRFPVTALPVMLAGFFASALGEEVGWSGYAVDPLQERWGALRAAIVLGVIWAVWHTVPLLQANRAAGWIAWWCLGTVGSRVLIVWLYNNAGKSVLAAILYHTFSNLSWQLFPTHGSHYDPRLTGLLIVLAAAVVTMLWGPRTLGRPARAVGAGAPAPAAPRRILVLGGGFGGVTATRHLERLCRGHPHVEITLVSRDNFFVLTPLLFEACSGRLELRHCAQPIRPALRRARFIEATVEQVDVDRRTARAVAADGAAYDLPYDQLVVALGAETNEGLIPGSRTAFTFKTMADALLLRNHVIEQFERADVTSDPALRSRSLTFVVIGGGLVGVELLGELTAFAEDVLRYYPRLRRDELRFHLFEAGGRILPEVDPALAGVATRVLQRRGADIRAAAPVRSVEPGRIHLADTAIDAGTIVLAAGIVPNAATARIPVAHDARGRIEVDATMRSRSHPDVWSLGDCAAIPAPDGRLYPALAQHAVREARHVARNLAAALDGRSPAPFVYRSLGTMASLGHARAVAQVMGVQVTGFPAWWLRRTYYLLQMPRWDRRLRIVLDWTVALFFRPDITKVEITAEQAGRR